MTREDVRSRVDRKLRRGERLDREDARYLAQEACMDDLSMWATRVRNQRHHPARATYLIMRIINTTNVCVSRCDFCAFYCSPGSERGYVLSHDQIFEKVDQLIALGGDFVGMNGGFNPALDLSWYADLFRVLRKRYGDSIEFYALTVPELMFVARHEGLTVSQACDTLRRAGARWITGGGAEILAKEFRRRHSPRKFTVDEYFEAQKAVIQSGLRTTATMVIGLDESLDERLEHLFRLRDFQDDTQGIFSFLSWTFKPENTEVGGQEISSEAYLRHLALSRLVLDNIPHIRTSVLTQNEAALRGLHFGANDFDIPLEDEVTQLAGAVIERDVEKTLRACQAEGFEPVYRFVARDPANRTHPLVWCGGRS